ncbi:hypothetical protein FXF51_06195 [Nonomuraea sp. PA05]|uniref:phage distal tail protein n=1 Tax=Nonomuraea sp. PA05 TaxID=2604466 RepID=UPI0011D3F352|nr:phage tail domain-containing protein [Nonomuraea sp. PA05]TYB69751.1 hypothetical protein FXF51_06195 [Nonomuraea sp. PA05]
MSRYGRAFPAPQRRTVPSYRGVPQQFTLPVFESVSEWPNLEVITPNVNVLLAPFESASEWPALTLRFEQRFTLAPFESLSEWPPLAVTIPVKPGDSLTGANGEVEWNGTLWGPATDVRVLLPVEGWLGSPSIDNLNVERPGRHGAWDARKVAKQRIVSIRLQPNSAADPTQVQDLIDQVLAVTGIPEDEAPLPLVIKAYGAPKLAYGQVVDRPLTLDGDYNVGMPTMGVVIACADPRLYSLERAGVTVPVGLPTTLANTGNASSHPVIRIEGPATNPVLTNQTLGRTLQFAITLGEGDLMEIDTDFGTATVADENVMSTLAGSSVPVSDFVLKAGSNTITYAVTSGGGEGADFLWRHATL